MAYDENGDFIQDPYYTGGAPSPYMPGEPQYNGGLNPTYSGGLANENTLNGRPGMGLISSGDPGTGSLLANSGTPAPNPSGGWFSQQGVDFGQSYKPFTEQFKAPSVQDMLNDPGYEARLNEGMNAIQRSAGAKGTLLTGGTLKGLAGFGQDYASNEYDKVYGRSLGEYLQRYNVDRNNQLDAFGMNTTNRQLSDSENAQAFNQWHQLDSDYYNRMFNLSGQGLNAAAGQAGTGSQVADYYTQIGNANAAGTAANGNIWGGVFGNVANTGLQDYYMKNLPK